jgi:hypothetical protein
MSGDLSSVGIERPTDDDMGQIGDMEAAAAEAPAPEAGGQVNTGAASPLGSAPAPAPGAPA